MPRLCAAKPLSMSQFMQFEKLFKHVLKYTACSAVRGYWITVTKQPWIDSDVYFRFYKRKAYCFVSILFRSADEKS